MVIKVKDAEEFRRLLTALIDELSVAHNHYRLFKDLDAAAPEFLMELNMSTTFWFLTRRAQIETALGRLCKAYDQEAKALNLVNLIDTIAANLHFFSDANFRQRLQGNPFVDSLAATSRIPEVAQLESDRRFVGVKTNPMVKKLMLWRGNFVSHHSPSYALNPSKLNDEYPLLYSEIESLIAGGIRISNQYSSLFAANTTAPTIMGHDDFREVLIAVQQVRKRREAELEAEYQKHAHPNV